MNYNINIFKENFDVVARKLSHMYDSLPKHPFRSCYNIDMDISQTFGYMRDLK